MRLAYLHPPTDNQPLSIQQAIQLLIRYPKKARYAPNERYKYSNTNYILLAGIIEKVSGQSFELFLQENLFVPLGMKDSRVWNLQSTLPFPNRVADFKRKWGKKVNFPTSFIDGVAGDGAVFCSSQDLVKWDQFWYQNSLVSPDLLDQALQPVPLNNGKTSDYGFGWIIGDNWIWHNGGWLGARTYIGRNPTQKLTFVLLDNSANSRGHIIARKIQKHYLNYINPLLGSKSIQNLLLINLSSYNYLCSFSVFRSSKQKEYPHFR